MNKGSGKRLSNDVICSIFFFLVFGLFLTQSISSLEMFLFPKILSVLGMLMTLGIFFTSSSKVCEKMKEDQQDDFMVFLLSIFLYLCMFFAKHVGFFLMLFIIAIGLYSVITRFCGLRIKDCIPKILLPSVITVVVLYLVFDLVLGIPVPHGFTI